MKKNISSLSFIDLFSGCGGLSHGLEMAGHECLLGVDADSHALKTFAANHPKAEVYLGDIKNLSAGKLQELLRGKKIDMVVGGPPCQGFSTVGKGVVEDKRNLLFKEFVRLVKITQPRIILFENVTGLLAKKNETILSKIFYQFETLGYNMDAQVLSAEEFGVPERRRRTIIMGVKNGFCLFPKPTHGKEGTQKIRTVSETFKNLKSSQGEIFNHDLKKCVVKKSLDQKRLSFIPAGKGIRYEEDEKKYLPKKLRYEINWDELRENRFRQTKLQRLPLDGPSPTILTSRVSYYHPTENRYLSPREAAAIQSFPNDFIFHGPTSSIFRQIGNAVPPLLGKALGEAIKNIQYRSRVVKNRMAPALLAKKAFHYDDSPSLS